MLKESFCDMIVAGISKNWSLPAFSNYNGSPISYGEVAEQIVRIHLKFKELHINKGDKVALIAKNCCNWALTYLATITYGASIVPILTDFHIDDFHHIVNHSDSKLLIVSTTVFEKIDENKMPDVEAILSIDDYKLLYSQKKSTANHLETTEKKFRKAYPDGVTRENFNLPETADFEIAGIVYTSGTSGFSKGVMLPHRSLAANVRFARENIKLKVGDPIVSFLPLAHTFGCTFDLLFPFCVGCHITFLGKIPSPKILTQAFAAIRPRLILTVPLVIEKIYKNHLRALLRKKSISLLTKVPLLNTTIYNKIRKKLIGVFGGNFLEIVVGGASLSDEVEAFLKKIKFPFSVGYGMTECGPLISYRPWQEHKQFSVGKLVDTLSVRIDSSITETNDGTGEIQVKGESVMKGYYKNNEATKSTLDDDGWLHTGDIGFIDEDGYLFIKGRHKSMLLGPSGQNIYPEEIETRINNMPFVAESLVIEKEEKLVALVYPDMELADAEDLNERELALKMENNRRLINEELPVYSRISKFELYPEEFEKTPTRKIKRFLYIIPHSSANKGKK
ncbi:MAG: long-chain fatty acid--CoA ligase [bacterium]|nr:long-chain fatty acid--CoA ligase [bacterium]